MDSRLCRRPTSKSLGSWEALFAHQVLIALVGGVDGHAGVAQHGLGPGRGHHQITPRLAHDGIAQMPQIARLLLVLHLGVGQRRDAVGAPVDDAGALIDQALLIQGDEHLAHGLRAALVHGEAGAAPVAGGAHFALLAHDGVSVLVLPVPDALQELLAAQVVAAQSLPDAEVLLHLDLGGDAGVVRAGQPQGVVALHALIADQDVLQRAVHGVSHVQLAGDVGGRHNDGEGLFVPSPVGAEPAAVHPEIVDASFHLCGVVDLGKLFHILSSETKTPRECSRGA